MRKTSLLNSNISLVISKMGHTDMLAIGDCGLPIPKETERIDLALIKGVLRKQRSICTRWDTDGSATLEVILP